MMNAKEFREFGYAAVDFVADYMENVHDRFIYFCEDFERVIVLMKNANF